MSLKKNNVFWDTYMTENTFTRRCLVFFLTCQSHTTKAHFRHWRIYWSVSDVTGWSLRIIRNAGIKIERIIKIWSEYTENGHTWNDFSNTTEASDSCKREGMKQVTLMTLAMSCAYKKKVIKAKMVNKKERKRKENNRLITSITKKAVEAVPAMETTKKIVLSKAHYHKLFISTWRSYHEYLEPG